MKNSQPNFGITLDDLVCFRGVNPSNPNHNRDALSLIRDGIELFEIPKEDLGVPLDILEQGNSVNVLAVYLGLGHLLKNRKIPVTQNEQPEFNLGQETSCGPCKKVEVDYDALLKESPRTVIGALNNLGWSYTGTRWYRQRGFSDFGRGFADRVGKLGSAVKDQFMHSLSEARTTHYAQPPLTANIELVFRLLSEAYAAKHGEDFSVEQEGYKVSRLKTRSETECRVGRLYITRQRVFDNGRTTYTCTCPGYSYRPQRDCKHIKEMKSAQYPV